MSRRSIVTLAIASVAIFMVTLDNLVVTTALPSIRRDLGASLEDLEWTVNGYTLAFAVFLLTGAALGDRFGRRRMFLAGVGLFTAASAFAALAPSTDALIAARALQGLGGAIVAPLTLTLLSEAFPGARRGGGRRSRAERGVPGGAAGRGPRDLVGRGRSRGRHGAARGRRDHRGRVLAVDLLGERARRARAAAGRAPRPGREPRARRPPRRARRRARHRRPARRRLRHSARERTGVGERDGDRLLRRRLRRARAVRAVGAPGARADVAAALLPLAGVRRDVPRLAGDGVRDLRGDLPARPVLPDGVGLRAARGRAADAAVDGHADDRRPDRRRAVGPHRVAAAGGGPGAAPRRRHRVARGRDGDGRRLRDARARLRARRDGHGARVLAG